MQQSAQKSGPLAVVTGANAGLGFETARGLVYQHYRVVLAARNEEKGEAAVQALLHDCPRADVRFAPLDLSRLASVRAFAAGLREQGAPIEVLINNAGIMALPERELTEDGFERQLGVNYLGHFLLTSELLPLLTTAEAPRVVQLSSLAHRGGTIDFDDLHGERRYDPWRAYRQSKLAMLLFSQALQAKSDSNTWGIDSLAAHPGLSRTALFEHGVQSRALIGTLFRLALPILTQSAADGAKTVLHAATASDIRPGDYFGPGGLAETRGRPTHARFSRAARDEALAERLWDISCELTGARWEDGSDTP